MEIKDGAVSPESSVAALPADAMGRRDRIFVFIALVLGFLLFELILFEGFGISLPIYLVVFYASVFWYLKGKPGGIDKRGLPLLLPIGLLVTCFALYDNRLLAALNFLLLAVLVAFQLATMTGNRLYKTFSLGLLIDLFHTGVALPLINIPAPFLAMKRKHGSARGKGMGQVLIGLAISVPVMAVVLALLSSADAVFERALNSAFNYFHVNVWEYIGKVVLGAFVAVPLFGLLYALRNNKRIGKMKWNINLSRLQAVDATILGTVLVMVCAAYVAFILIQFGYLLNAFSSILPAGFGYAEYARRGFLELMAVVCVNLFLLAASMLFGKHNGHNSVMKLMETVLVVLTLFLIASAFSKMVLYMDAYGLTLLRLYTSWFMLLCAVVFVAMLIKVHAPKFALTRFCAIAFVALFLALNYANVDALIPQYNIQRFESGKEKTVDVDTFYDLSDSMIPHAVTLLDAKDPKTARMARVLLEDRAAILEDNRWQVFSVARQNAINALRAKGITYHPRPADAETTDGR